MKNGKLRMVAAGLLGLAASGSVFAQEASTTMDAQASGQAEVGMGLPGGDATTTTTTNATATTTAAAVAPGATDHEGVVGRMAVGYLGRSNIQVGLTDGGGASLPAPIIGIRYWLDPGMGLDLGLGLALQGGSSETAGVEDDAPTFFGLLLHGGVPLALASGRHYVFEIIPEANIGFGTGSGDDVDHSGFLLDVGARAGAEVHFGFIGIPELSLQASVGALFSLQSSKTTVDGAGGEVESSESAWAFRTTVQNSPWNIFTSNVAAFYYF
jgi:hypothetical protein